jgi:hypothetical protein
MSVIDGKPVERFAALLDDNNSQADLRSYRSINVLDSRIKCNNSQSQNYVSLEEGISGVRIIYFRI